jgi:hypothetical protein
MVNSVLHKRWQRSWFLITLPRRRGYAAVFARTNTRTHAHTHIHTKRVSERNDQLAAPTPLSRHMSAGLTTHLGEVGHSPDAGSERAPVEMHIGKLHPIHRAPGARRCGEACRPGLSEGRKAIGASGARGAGRSARWLRQEEAAAAARRAGVERTARAVRGPTARIPAVYQLTETEAERRRSE